MSRRQECAREKNPAGYQALLASADGNCLFNSISILLFGDERYASHLRLATIIQAVDHYNHYVKMVSSPMYMDKRHILPFQVLCCGMGTLYMLFIFTS